MNIFKSVGKRAAKAYADDGLRAGYKVGKEALRKDIPIAPNFRKSQEMLGRMSIRRSTGQNRSVEKAMAIGSRRMKYGAATAAGMAVYGSAMSNTRYDKSYGSSGRYGINPRSTGGFA